MDDTFMKKKWNLPPLQVEEIINVPLSNTSLSNSSLENIEPYVHGKKKGLSNNTQKLMLYIDRIRKLEHLSITDLQTVYQFDNDSKNLLLMEYNHAIHGISELLESLLSIERILSEIKHSSNPSILE
jgi:transglutaminase/protease-like cytokinesis protein 3